MPTLDVNTMIVLWEQVLKLEGLDPSSDFFDLGGHSISAARLLQAVEEMYGVALPLNAIFDHSTIEEFTEIVREARGDERA
jgi:acyl carrier protein